MTKNLNLESWLAEQDIPPLAGQPDMPQGGGGANPLGTGPGGYPPQEAPPEDPNITQQGLPEQPPEEDVNDDPENPYMPDEQEDLGFEQWKNKYFKASIKGDPNELEELLKDVRDRDLEAYEEKFVEDNIRIQHLRQQSNIKDASSKIRRLIREQLDKNNPASSIANHMHETLMSSPELVNVFIKMEGLLGAKGDPHRKYITSLVSGVQVGSGSTTEDVIFNEKEYSLNISTRINAEFGNLMVGRWSLREDDPEKFLDESELERLDVGSPEEKDVLRRRVVMESIADKYKKRAFIFNSIDENGTVYLIGWDMANSLKAAYKDGKLVVRSVKSENSEAMIDDNGAIISQLDLKINYVKPTGQLDASGEKETKEILFMERRDGMLWLMADIPLLKEASSTLQGLVFKEFPYNGNPSDLKALKRVAPETTELLLRNP
jgi:hypothetical protein